MMLVTRVMYAMVTPDSDIIDCRVIERMNRRPRRGVGLFYKVSWRMMYFRDVGLCILDANIITNIIYT